ncbi:MAG TPA: 3-oxoacyl-ACP reductase family protein [Acidimicrobiales bacterium]|nr:3-oxoacyl-ACP reductase family protein [Acidimicrobiales bacterium]
MTDRVALVTGAGQGIGRAIAERLAEAGHRVAVADLNPTTAEEAADAIRKLGATAMPVTVDVADTVSVQAAAATIAAALGPIDVVVNNAGFDVLMPFLETTEEFWDRILDVNFKGALRVIQAAAPGMVDRRWGRIVNIASDAGRVGSSLEAVYSGAKGGIIAFSKTLARELARTGVTVNCVCPGPTDTPLLQGIAEAGGDDSAKVIGAMTRAVPMKRLAQPSDIAGAVAYFASDAAAYVTGQTLSVSGGLTMA